MLQIVAFKYPRLKLLNDNLEDRCFHKTHRKLDFLV